MARTAKMTKALIAKRRKLWQARSRARDAIYDNTHAGENSPFNTAFDACDDATKDAYSKAYNSLLDFDLQMVEDGRGWFEDGRVILRGYDYRNMLAE